jgi:hypothetical protein
MTLLSALSDEIGRVFRKRRALFRLQFLSVPHHLRRNYAIRRFRYGIRGGHGLLEHVCYIGGHRYILCRGGDLDSALEGRVYIDGQPRPGSRTLMHPFAGHFNTPRFDRSVS